MEPNTQPNTGNPATGQTTGGQSSQTEGTPTGTQPVVPQPAAQPASPAATAQPAPTGSGFAASTATTPTGTNRNVAAVTGEPIDLNAIKTKSGKTIKDFEIPAELIQKDPALIDLVIRSESMNDGERQYWFNLTEIMSEEQVQKLRDILTRERKKLIEIEQKYGKPKVQLSPEEIAARNAELQQKRTAQREKIAAREKALEAQEAENEAAILAELEGL